MRIPSPRVQILDKQQELERTHCEGCDIRNKISIEKTADIAFRNCLDNCNIGKHLNHLGKMLLDHKAMSVRKPKFVSEIKTFKKEVVKVAVVKLTKEIYQKLKSQSPSKSDAWIVSEYGYNNVSFYKLKNTWGLVSGKGRSPDAPIKKKTLADVTFVEEEPKQEFNPNVLVGLAEEKIKKLEETLIEKDSIIKKLNDLISDDIGFTDKLKATIFEKDNFIKNLHNLRSEDVGVIDELKEKLNHANESLELSMGNIRKLNNALQGDNDFFVKTLDEKNAEIDTLTTRSKSFDKERDNILNTIQPMQEELNRLYNQQKNYSKNKEKVFRLESLISHSEKTNDSLIAQIKSLSKFKTLYFKTAETLKLHLPN